MEDHVYSAMMDFVLIRHCKAEGQEPDAPLTSEGFRQTQTLKKLLIDVGVQRIVSSPYIRAIQSIQPFAQASLLEVAVDDRLIERILSGSPRTDWMNSLEQSFMDLDLCFEGGESSRQATERALSLLSEYNFSDIRTAIVTHGNLLALILKNFSSDIGFAHWQKLSNPDVFHLTVSSGIARIRRLWGCP